MAQVVAGCRQRLQKLGQRQIARSVNTSQSTVHEYLTRMKTAGLSWPLGEDWSEQRLEQALFPSAITATKTPQRTQPDYARIREQLERHRDLTIELLWEEYREQNPDGYSYSRFCKLYRGWKKQQDVVLRQQHRPGEKLFLDWAGATISIHRPDGVTRPAAIFVSALGASSYTYAEAVEDQQMANWLKVQMNAFEFYGGVTQYGLSLSGQRGFGTPHSRFSMPVVLSPAPPFSSFSFHSDHRSSIPITFGAELRRVIRIRRER